MSFTNHYHTDSEGSSTEDSLSERSLSQDSLNFCENKEDEKEIKHKEFRLFLNNINKKFNTRFTFNYIIKNFKHVLTQFIYYDDTPFEHRRMLPTRNIHMNVDSYTKNYILEDDDICLSVVYLNSDDSILSMNILSV